MKSDSIDFLTNNLGFRFPLDWAGQCDDVYPLVGSPETVKFDLPQACRFFTPFSRLPTEMRQQIWLETLPTGGIHFLKIETRGRAWRWTDSRFSESQSPGMACYATFDQKKRDEIVHEVKNEIQPRKISGSRLAPVSPSPTVDHSFYKTLRQHLATLFAVSAETADLVRSLTSTRKALRLTDGGLVSLHSSCDLVYLEYLSEELFSTGSNLGFAPDCPQLDCIRRLAVRYCRAWEREFTRTCVTCGQIHDKSQESGYPAHLYQFLARHLPQLEEFYFIDYFLVRKNKIKLLRYDETIETILSNSYGSQRSWLQSFHAQNATYHEAMNTHWTIRPEMNRIKSWVQDRFVRYAEASKFSRHPFPERVRFGILACEWDIRAPTSHENELPPRKIIWKGSSSVDEISPRPRKARHAVTSETKKDGDGMEGIVGPLFPTGLPVVFGENDANVFPFTFRMPLL